MNNEQRLLSLKADIENINADLIRSQERLNQYLSQLVEYGMGSVEQAESEYKKLSDSIPKLEQEFNELLSKIETMIERVK
jgi:chromosome segregation ATPase